MVTITVVEPNTLLRLGILNLLKTLDCHACCQGIDYVQLFDGDKPHTSSIDLMLLSVPANYNHIKELVTTAQTRFCPCRILLLADTQEPYYSLLNLPPILAGYVYKFASQDILKTSILLALAGGKCFPQPDMAHSNKQDMSFERDDPAPRRRWYERTNAFPCPPNDGLAIEKPSYPAPMIIPAQKDQPEPARLPPEEQLPHQAQLPDHIKQEAALLHLTSRQYGILTLMAKGYSLKGISRELAISVATVKTHTEALYQRLGANNRNAAIYAAVSRGATLGCWHGSHEPASDQPPSQPSANTSD